MKRITSMILCLIICATMFVMLVGCECRHDWRSATCTNPKTCSKCGAIEGNALGHNYNNGKCVHCQGIDPQKDIEYQAAKNAYNSLIEVHSLAIDVMDSIYSAWYFAIYQADDYDYNVVVDAFNIVTGLYTNNAIDAILEEMNLPSGGIFPSVLIEDFSTAVAIVQRVFETDGTYDKIDAKLSSAQTEIKKLTNQYADYTGLNTLKSYYTEVSAYAAFCKAPNGSFSQLQTTMNNYENNLNRYKQELAFYLS